MTVTTEEKIALVEELLEDLRWARGTKAPEAATYDKLLAIATDLRATTPKEIGRVLAAMLDQIQRARRFRARNGYYQTGHMQTITEALCGRWWPTVERSLQQQGTKDEEAARD